MLYYNSAESNENELQIERSSSTMLCGAERTEKELWQK